MKASEKRRRKVKERKEKERKKRRRGGQNVGGQRRGEERRAERLLRVTAGRDAAESRRAIPLVLSCMVW